MGGYICTHHINHQDHEYLKAIGKPLPTIITVVKPPSLRTLTSLFTRYAKFPHRLLLAVRLGIAALVRPHLLERRFACIQEVVAERRDVA